MIAWRRTWGTSFSGRPPPWGRCVSPPGEPSGLPGPRGLLASAQKTSPLFEKRAFHFALRPIDSRGGLTWRDRFGDIQQAHNYYSPGDEVLANNTSGETQIIPDENGAWVYQERIKGLWQPVLLPGVDSHGGWGFNTLYNVITPGGGGMSVHRPADQTDQLVNDPDMLRTNSFFKLFNRPELYTTNGSAVASQPAVKATLLAEALPAITRAMGCNPLASFQGRNTDLMTLRNGWPESRPQPQGQTEKPWLHSDFKDVAYRYVYPFYRDMIQKGGLQ